MNFPDPFPGYSVLLRVLVYGVTPAFCIWQFVRLRKALHVFQLEGYKRDRFVKWCLANKPRALFLGPPSAKKPLVMTGRAWRIVVLATLLSAGFILVPWFVLHLAVGFPADLIVWTFMTVDTFVTAPLILVTADLLLAPVQSFINASYGTKAARRLQEVSPVVIGVTGSFGKTSTKLAIAGLVGPPGTAFATPGSYNTPMGITRAINEGLAKGHRYFVVEMGAYGAGEIAELCDIVHPSIGVLTAIGPAHLERFGSLDAIRRAKYELIESLPEKGTAVMNVDDPEVRALADTTGFVAVVRYGIESSGRPDVTARGIETTKDGTRFTLVDARSGTEADAHTRLLGRHAVGHVLAGAAVALTLGRSLEEIARASRELQPVQHRLQMIPGAGGVTVVDDAFNSNPEGAAAALEVLSEIPARKRVVVTPGIIELGSMQREANETFGERAASVADTLIVVARVNRDAILAGAKRAGNGAEVIAVDSLAEATERLKSILGPGDVVLFENDLPDQYEN